MEREHRLVVTRIERNLIRQNRPSTVFVTIFDSIGKELQRLPLPISRFRGQIEEAQELVLVPKELMDKLDPEGIFKN